MVGSTPESVLTPPQFIQAALKRDTICVDACIVDVLEDVWRHGLMTYGCCCGHNDEMRRSIIINAQDQTRVRSIVGDSFHLINVEDID